MAPHEREEERETERQRKREEVERDQKKGLKEEEKSRRRKQMKGVVLLFSPLFSPETLLCMHGVAQLPQRGALLAHSPPVSALETRHQATGLRRLPQIQISLSSVKLGRTFSQTMEDKDENERVVIAHTGCNKTHTYFV